MKNKIYAVLTLLSFPFTNYAVLASETNNNWPERIVVSGAIEVELSSGDTYAGADTSDIALATLAIGIDAHINELTNAHIVLLHEDDDTEPQEVDEAIITLGGVNDIPYYLSAGRMYVPFGAFNSNMVSDPLTLELGETREAAVLVGYQNAGFRSAIYAFNGDTNKSPATDNQTEQYGIDLGYTIENDRMTFDMGIGYTSSIGDSDTLATKLSTTTITDYVGGISAHIAYSRASFDMFVEYTAATDNFQNSELTFKSRGAEPSSYNVEFGYHFTLSGKEATLGLALQGSDEALAVELPESRYSIALSSEIMKNTSLAAEWRYDDDYAVADGGTGKSANQFTFQLAVEF